MNPNRFQYLKSLANEVLVQSQRIRDLIGSSHWLSDGHHKEYLLADLIRRHLPVGVSASRGFVIQPTSPYNCSKEQDILIFDHLNEAPVFNQSGIVIVFPKNVIATISVKTTLDKKTFLDSVENFSSILSICNTESCKKMFFGGYFYEFSEEVSNNKLIVRKYFDEAVRAGVFRLADYGYNLCMCLGADLIFRLQQSDAKCESAEFSGFNCNKLATGVFLANLIDHVCTYRNSESAFSEYAAFTLDPLK